jgi:hypothetical protein
LFGGFGNSGGFAAATRQGDSNKFGSTSTAASGGGSSQPFGVQQQQKTPITFGMCVCFDFDYCNVIVYYFCRFQCNC